MLVGDTLSMFKPCRLYFRGIQVLEREVKRSKQYNSHPTDFHVTVTSLV
jgi:hypothetical protein